MAEAIPTTKLEAVNAMLHDIGDRPVSSITNSTRLDVVRAINSLEQVSRQMQLMGWWFGRETVTVAIDGNNRFTIPDSYANVEVVKDDPSGATYTPHLVVRGRVLYDRENATDEFPLASPVTLRVTRLLEYEDLPQTAREYVYAAASVRNQSRSIGSNAVDGDLRAQAASAYASLQSEDFDNENYDQTYSPSFVTMMHNR